jgi:hypothetical protein
VGAHDGQFKVGVIETIERLPDGRIWGTGSFSDSDEGRAAAEEAARRATEGMPYGISVDLDDVSMELRVRKEVLDGLSELPTEEDMAAAMEADENGRIKVAGFKSGDFMTVFTSARVRMATLCDCPAFIDAGITVTPAADDDASLSAEMEQMAAENSGEYLVASAYPVAPPAEWFENPGFTAETPLQIDDNGRIYGHAATWGTFHIGFAGQRIEAPRSMANYAYFRTGVIRTAEGADIPIGQITLGTGHATGDLGELDARSHYDHTGTAACDVACGDDGYGIWVAGALRPGVTDEQVRELRAAALSGDWREIGGNLELVALLAVNTPGFMVPRMSAMVASGSVRSLVASAAFGITDDDTVELTREEKLAVKEMLAKNLAIKNPAKDVAPEYMADDPEIKKTRAESARRRFRAEKARLRVIRNTKGS